MILRMQASLIPREVQTYANVNSRNNHCVYYAFNNTPSALDVRR